MKKLSSKQADLLMLFVALLWGSGYIFTKNALDSLSAMQIMVLRFASASILCIVFFRKKLKYIDRQYVINGSIMGFFLATGFLFQTKGIELTTTANNAFITSTNVVMVPFIYWLLIRKKPKTNNIVAAFLMLTGIFFLTFNFENLGNFNAGDFLTLIGALFFAFHIVSTGYFVEEKDPVLLSTIQILFCLIYFGIILIFDKSVETISLSNVWNSMYLGVVSTFVCFSLQTTAQKFTTASHAAIILSLESVIGSILAILILKEKYNNYIFLGFVIIFVSVLVAEVGDKIFTRTDK